SNHRAGSEYVYGFARLRFFHMPRRIIPIVILLVPALWLAVNPATSATAQAKARELKLVPHRISLANGKAFDLNLPEEFGISVAAQGLKRVRFMARSPDGRIFVTDMY